MRYVTLHATYSILGSGDHIYLHVKHMAQAKIIFAITISNTRVSVIQRENL
jgi:hypothetical protein